jgi:hypothetical protein
MILITITDPIFYAGVSKKTKKSIKSRKLEKKTEKIEPWKKPIRILKTSTGSIRFYKPETKKTESNPNWKNRAKPEKTRAKLVWTGFCFKKRNRIETARFESVSFFFNFGLVIFFYKSRIKPKIITLTFILLWLNDPCSFFHQTNDVPYMIEEWFFFFINFI